MEVKSTLVSILLFELDVCDLVTLQCKFFEIASSTIFFLCYKNCLSTRDVLMESQKAVSV